MASGAAGVPLVDVAPFAGGGGDRRAAAEALGRACREVGFFYAVGHGVEPALEVRLVDAAQRFFAQDADAKLAIRMERGGRAWRGYFPVGAELTSGRPDWKEGVYFGAELADAHPRVRDGTPLHGRNLFPDLPGFREAVLAWMDAMTGLGHALVAGLAESLGLPGAWFAERYTADPTVLFRIFRYPPIPEEAGGDPLWSVGEHSDYGLLTILLQDDTGGLQVKTRAGWIDAPPLPGSFVCNLGDMLDRMTGGRYRSTPHRVRNPSARHRLSFPFFFDPGWDAELRPIPGCEAVHDDAAERWDGASVHAFEGRYGDYLLAKVSKVFPELRRSVL
jgi:isopenicillin N synthase-like dioxygenase